MLEMNLATTAKQLEKRLHQTAISASNALECDQAACLSDFHRLIMAQNAQFRKCGIVALARSKFDALLEAEAYESAALSFLDEGCGWMASTSGSGRAIVTLVLPASDREISAQAPTLSLAFILSITGAVRSRLFLAHE